MPKFRKKPVVIEAVEYQDIGTEWPLWASEAFREGVLYFETLSRTPTEPALCIETLEGTMTVGLGDFVIQGVKGEIYPCKPDIFAATYEPVGDDNA